MFSNGARGRLVRRLVLGVNLTLAGFLGLFVSIDVYLARRNLMNREVTDLQENATLLLTSVTRLSRRGTSAVQDFLDDINVAMQPIRAADSPHRILVRVGPKKFEARQNDPSGPEALAEAAAAAAAADHRGMVDGQPAIVGGAGHGDVAAYIIEPYSQTEHAIFLLIVRRAAANTLAGVGIAAALNVMLQLWLVRPLGRMVDTVQQFGRGHLAARMPPNRSRELGLLTDEFNAMATVLERTEADRRGQMDRARAIQDCLRPDLKEISGARYACINQPAAEVAGDYYDVMPSADGGVILCVADVSGQGVPAAMGAAMLKTLLLNSAERESDPPKLLALLNAAFCRVTLPEDFATMALLHFTPGSPTAAYASAGHEPVFLLHYSTGRTEDLKATGFPIGVQSPSTWEVRPLTVEPGDRLIMLTNGLVETKNPAGEAYSRDRLLGDLMDLRTRPLEQMLAGILSRVIAYRGAAPQQDDLTALAVEFTAAGNKAS
jgi:sigma-B regulation protein RsbU (phosphoserine phosphatase)